MSLPEENVAFMHRIDNVLFSHAGLALSFVLENLGYGGSPDIDMIVDHVNRMGYQELWKDGGIRLYPPGYVTGGRTYSGKTFNA